MILFYQAIFPSILTIEFLHVSMLNKGTDGKQEVPEISSTPLNVMIIYSIFCFNIISLSRLANASKKNGNEKN